MMSESDEATHFACLDSTMRRSEKNADNPRPSGQSNKLPLYPMADRAIERTREVVALEEEIVKFYARNWRIATHPRKKAEKKRDHYKKVNETLPCSYFRA
jgi:hypothetical protein